MEELDKLLTPTRFVSLTIVTGKRQRSPPPSTPVLPRRIFSELLEKSM